jgi:hypothetical protein
MRHLTVKTLTATPASTFREAAAHNGARGGTGKLGKAGWETDNIHERDEHGPGITVRQ